MGRRQQANNTPVKWEELTEDERNRFTMNDTVEKKDWWRGNDMNSAAENNFYSKELVDSMIGKILKKEVTCYGSYPKTTEMLYDCLEKYPIIDQTAAVMGSVTPWHEAMCLAYGGIPTTIEYNKLHTDDERLNLMTVEEYNKNPFKFDAAFSISSFEHDGLGRYGDPINPDGDLEAMKNIKDNVLKKGGLLYFGVPVGEDAVWWNAHRMYGIKRWSKLIEGYEVVYCPDDSLDDALRFKHVGRDYYQPAIVLRSV